MQGEGVAMRRRFFWLFFAVACLQLLSCSQEKKEASETLAKIDGYVLTLDEFQSQLAAEVEFDRDFKLTEEAKKTFLENLIRKELLIQEAKKRELDRKEKFIRAIERYWEATLIRDLMEMKGNEIEKRTVVSQEEIEARYNEMKKSDDQIPPLENMTEQIRKKIVEEKKSKMLGEWIDDLRKKARVEINEELLSKK